ncbi:hypothetical protein MKX01_025835 [Papaver californicum]|nr:hypothetical protein MKX01_025835 [Papaver californicum]
MTQESGGLIWKRNKLATTRKANAKKGLLRIWQNEALLKACAAQFLQKLQRVACPHQR